MSFFRRAGALIARFFTSAADPAAAANEFQLYSKDDAGVSQLYGRSDDGTIHQLTPIATPASPTPANNLLRNSGFWFAQRQNPAALTTYTGSAAVRVFTADGWAITNENASAQYIRTDTSGAPEANLASRYYGRFTKITSTGKIQITQCVESADSQNVRGRTVRVQIKMRGLVAASVLWNVGLVRYTGIADLGSMGAFISAQGANGTDPTLAAVCAYLTPNGAFPADGGVIVGNKIQATITNDPTWVRVGGCFDVPATADNLFVMIWSDSGVVATNGVALGEANLVDSAEIQNWEPLPVPLELTRTQRFYSKSFDIDTVPATGAANGYVIGWVNSSGAVAGQRIPIRFPVTMRKPPTMNTYGIGTSNLVLNFPAATSATATTTAAVSSNGVRVDFTGLAGWTVGEAVGIHFTADAEL